MKRSIMIALMGVLLTGSLCFAEGNVSQAWFDAGFDEFDASHWMTSLFDFESAKAWRAAGFDYGSAHNWHKRHFSIAEAVAWRESGMKSAKNAKRLRKVGVDVTEYKAWRGKGYKKAKEIVALKKKGVRVGDAPDKASSDKSVGNFRNR